MALKAALVKDLNRLVASPSVIAGSPSQLVVCEMRQLS